MHTHEERVELREKGERLFFFFLLFLFSERERERGETPEHRGEVWCGVEFVLCVWSWGGLSWFYNTLRIA
jgi:hypothetical protein